MKKNFVCKKTSPISKVFPQCNIINHDSIFLNFSWNSKNINTDRIFPKLSFVCTRDTKISFKIFLLIKIIQILILIHPLQVTSGVKLPIGMNLPCPISSFLLLHLRFFSCSFDGKHCPMALDWHLQVTGPKVFTSKNAF